MLLHARCSCGLGSGHCSVGQLDSGHGTSLQGPGVNVPLSSSMQPLSVLLIPIPIRINLVRVRVQRLLRYCGTALLLTLSAGVWLWLWQLSAEYIALASVSRSVHSTPRLHLPFIPTATVENKSGASVVPTGISPRIISRTTVRRYRDYARGGSNIPLSPSVALASD